MDGGGGAGVIAVLVAPGTLRPDTAIGLPESESHHLRVRRAAAGDRLRLHDGAGVIGQGVLLGVGKEVRAQVESVQSHPAPAPLRLVVGAGDKERFGWLAEKCAELGVTELVPLAASLCQGVATRLREAGLERVRRQALEAIKQSGAAWAPAVTELHTVGQACARFATGLRWLADREGASPGLRDGQALTVVVGPEGGLTTDERQEFVAAGFRPVRLGPQVLRFETAAIAAAIIAGVPHLGGIDG